VVHETKAFDHGIDEKEQARRPEDRQGLAFCSSGEARLAVR
jgi:hypothetical protein